VRSSRQSKAAPAGFAGHTASNPVMSAAATSWAPARVTLIGSPDVRLASATYCSRSRPAITEFAKISAVLWSAARRRATGSGRILRCASMVREMYGGWTMLSSATAAPAVSRMTSRTGVRYAPAGPSAWMATKSAVPLADC
jgi:hypothetical protein